MQKLTSAAANKLIKTLEDKKDFLLQEELNKKDYVVSKGEKPEIPAYDFLQTNEAIGNLDTTIRKIKHALNFFNTSTVLPVGITIDEALVEMAQLNRKITRLDNMRREKDKVRLTGMQASRRDVTEMKMLNYDTQKVNEIYQSDMQRVQDIQMALDKANQTIEFEVEI